MTAIDVGEETHTEVIMDRADVFRAAYALVKGLEWARDFDVLDVTRVAEFLEER